MSTHRTWTSLSAVAAGASVICGCGGIVETTPAAESSGTGPGGGAGVLDGSSAQGGSLSVGGMASATGAGSGGSPAGGADNNCVAPVLYVDDPCGTTAAGVPVVKNGVCTATDQQLCDKSCGPGNVGYKTDTCAAGVYVESSTCTFPTNCWYRCFKVPTVDAPGCPATHPQRNQPCNLAICNLPCAETQTTPCEMCGVAAGYLDSSGAAQVGYCICVAASGGGGKFACGDIPGSWPCPWGRGC